MCISRFIGYQTLIVTYKDMSIFYCIMPNTVLILGTFENRTSSLSRITHMLKIQHTSLTIFK